MAQIGTRPSVQVDVRPPQTEAAQLRSHDLGGSHTLQGSRANPPPRDACAPFLPAPESKQCHSSKAPRAHTPVQVRNTSHAHRVQTEGVRTHPYLRVPHLLPQATGDMGAGRWHRRERERAGPVVRPERAH